MESESVGSWAPPPPPPPRSPVGGGGGGGEGGRAVLSSETTPGRGGDRGCFRCKQEGHWFQDCPERTVRAGPGPSDRTASGHDSPVRQCPCGAGPCLVLLSRTERNPNRLFYRCPVKSPGERCTFFKWCDTDSASADQLCGFGSPVKPDQFGASSPQKPNQEYGVRLSSPLKHDTNYGFKSPMKLDRHDSAAESSSPICSCGAGRCSILTKKDGDGAGRRYYACPIKKGQGACNFFQWVDSPPKSHELKIDHVGGNDHPNFDLVHMETEVPVMVDGGGEAKAEHGSKLEGMVPNAVDQRTPTPHQNREPHANDIAGLSFKKRLNFDQASPSAATNLGKCYRCGQDGHWMSECTASPPSVCFKCGKIGHWRKDCTS